MRGRGRPGPSVLSPWTFPLLAFSQLQNLHHSSSFGLISEEGMHPAYGKQKDLENNSSGLPPPSDPVYEMLHDAL